jgi:hypothetical protein
MNTKMLLLCCLQEKKELPCKDHFRAWAVDALTNLANDVTPAGTKLAAPSVTFRYGCKELVAMS